MRRCKNYSLELWVICLLAFALRLHLLEDISLHDDEARSVSLYIRQPASHIFINYIPNNHWLSNILGYGMAQLGQPRFLLRWPSLLCGVLAIPLLACTGYRLFRNRRLGLTAAWLLCLSAFHIQWSQQFRGYSPLLFFSLLSCYGLYEALKTGSKRSWYGFLIAAFLSLLSHLYGALVLVLAVVMIGLRCWRFRTKMRFLLPILILLGYLLWFGKIYIIDLLHPPLKVSLVQAMQYQRLAFWPTLSDLSQLFKTLAVAFSAQPNETVALTLFLGFGLAGFFILIRQASSAALLLLLWLIVPIGLVVIADLAITGFFVFDRYLIFLLPAWLLLVAGTMVTVTGGLAARLTSVSLYRQLIFSILLGAGLSYSGWLNLNAGRFYLAERAGHDWRTIAAYLAGQVTPNDLIICKELPHRWPPRRLDLGDQCTKELTHRLAEQGIKLRFPIKQLEIIASLNTGLRFKEQATRPGTIWLVMWGENVPFIEGNLQGGQRSISLPGRQVRGITALIRPGPAALPFDRLGHTLLLNVGAKSTLVANLGQALEQLAHLDTSSTDRYDYYLRQAQVMAYQGHIREAQLLLNKAKKLLDGQAPPLLETMAAMEKIKVNFIARPTPVATNLNVDFGQPALLRLTGYTLPSQFQPGQLVPLTFTWQTLAPISADYTIFLHLRNAANQTVAQLDFRPFDGAYPTYQWPANTQIEETRFWQAPKNMAPGPYNLHLGLYQVETWVHLPVQGDETGKEGILLSQIWIE
jgi:hypothetical protein